jgi:hypothetical protein
VWAAAFKAYFEAGGKMAAAVRRLDELHPEHPVANPFDFIQYWVNVFEQRFSVLDGRTRGPQPALSDGE